jgi:hypothetical protein
VLHLLFAKVCDVQTKLDSVGLEVDHVTWQLTRVKVELDYVTRKLDEERRLIRMSFALVVAMLTGIQYSIQWMIWSGHHSACFVPQDLNTTDDVHHETNMARSLARIIAEECFVWFFHE